MQPVSAADALGLAFAHTRSVLLPQPFRAGRFFRLALVAAFTQASFLSVAITYPLQGGQLAALSRARHSGSEQFLAAGGMGAFAGALGLGVLLVALVLVLLLTGAYLYVVCRARATLLDLVLIRAGRIRDAWRRQARPARRYFGIFLLAMLAFWTVLAAVLAPVIVRFVKVAVTHSAGVDATPQVGPLMLTLVGLIWLLVPFWIVVDTLLQDFILPGLTLDEQAPLSAAFVRLGTVFRARPGQMLLYLLLRTVVGFAIALALGLIVLVVLSLLALGGYGVGLLLYHLLWTGSLAAHALFFAAIAGMVLVILVLYLLSAVAIYGVTGTFKTSYAVYYLAGYYPQMAALLYPPETVLPNVNDSGSFAPALRTETNPPPELW